MSVSTIRQILETKLVEITPNITTTYENFEFTPVEGIPFQRVFFLFNEPDNAYISRNYTQGGYMQVDLNYPLLGGSTEATTRAEAIRSKFKSGEIFSTVKIARTPEIGSGRIQGDRFVIPVFVRFTQFIQEV